MTRKVWKEDRRERLAPESADITVNHGDEHRNENFSKRTETKINKKGKKNSKMTMCICMTADDMRMVVSHQTNKVAPSDTLLLSQQM